MSDVELVIKIPEETYKDIQSRDWKNGERWYSEEWKAIHNGTPIPSGWDKPNNSDVISRTGAIEALKAYFSDESMTKTEYGAYWHHVHVIDVLKALPPVTLNPCGDAIDRDEAIRVASGYCHFSNVPKELAKLPPVTPKSCEVEDAKQAYSKGFEDCRQAVLEQINCWIGSGEYRYTNATHYLMERVKHIPSVNPQEPKTGHWIEHNAKSYECSECHNTKSLYASYKTDYCHDCGVKMVELRESEDNENNNE